MFLEVCMHFSIYFHDSTTEIVSIRTKCHILILYIRSFKKMYKQLNFLCELQSDALRVMVNECPDYRRAAFFKKVN